MYENIGQKIKGLALLLAICMCLSACEGKIQQANSSINDASSQTTGVSGTQLEEDIKASTIVQNCFQSDFVYDSTFSYISHEIIKRQTNPDEKQDIIFCNITAKNKYFSVDFEATLEYVYYDVGGWILEKSKITNKQATPIAPAEKNLIIEFISDKGSFGYVKWYKTSSHATPTLENGYIGEIKTEIDAWLDDRLSYEPSMYTFGETSLDRENSCTLLSVTYKLGEVVKAEGNFRLFFDNQQGWSFLKVTNSETIFPVFEINNAQFDYSKTLGDFGRKNTVTGENVMYYTIKEIDIENERAYYLERRTRVGEPAKMIECDAEINLITATIKSYKDKLYGYHEGLYYILEKDAWVQDHSMGPSSTYVRFN